MTNETAMMERTSIDQLDSIKTDTDADRWLTDVMTLENVDSQMRCVLLATRSPVAGIIASTLQYGGILSLWRLNKENWCLYQAIANTLPSPETTNFFGRFKYPFLALCGCSEVWDSADLTDREIETKDHIRNYIGQMLRKDGFIITGPDNEIGDSWRETVKEIEKENERRQHEGE